MRQLCKLASLEDKILKLNSREEKDVELMKPKDARTRMDMANEYYNFLFSQVEKLELKLPESAAQDMFNSLNS